MKIDDTIQPYLVQASFRLRRSTFLMTNRLRVLMPKLMQDYMQVQLTTQKSYNFVPTVQSSLTDNRMTRTLLLCNLGYRSVSRIRCGYRSTFRLATFWCTGFALKRTVQ